MQSAKRSRIFEQLLDKDDGGRAKCSPALVLQEEDQDQLSPADLVDKPLLEITSVSIHMQWYAYIM